MLADLQRRYAEMTDDELLQVASDQQDLSDDARLALGTEMRSRNLVHADIFKHRASVSSAQHFEAARRNRKLFGRRRLLSDWVSFTLYTFLLFFIAALIATWLVRR